MLGPSSHAYRPTGNLDRNAHAKTIRARCSEQATQERGAEYDEDERGEQAETVIPLTPGDQGTTHQEHEGRAPLKCQHQRPVAPASPWWRSRET